MGILLRRRVIWVTVKPYAEGEIPGHTSYSDVKAKDMNSKRPLWEYKREIKLLLAGPIAELIEMSDKEFPEHCNCDLCFAEQYLKIMSKYSLSETHSFDPKKEIEEQIIELCNSNLQLYAKETKQELKDNWTYVKLIANALLEQTTLTGKQVKQIMDRA